MYVLHWCPSSQWLVFLIWALSAFAVVWQYPVLGDLFPGGALCTHFVLQSICQCEVILCKPELEPHAWLNLRVQQSPKHGLRHVSSGFLYPIPSLLKYPCLLQFSLLPGIDVVCFAHWQIFRATVIAQMSFLVASEAPRSARHWEGTVKRKNPGSFDSAVTGAEGKAFVPARAREGAVLLPFLPASSLLFSHLQESLGKCLQEEMQRNKETLESAVKVGMPVQLWGHAQP